jgi:2-amino-4-hydroxy-6-hydroxymethyldihydropteridine diphosphokinase
MAEVFIALGSNIHPAENIKKALRRLSEEMRIRRISTIYCTEPEGNPEQPLYLNCVLEAESKSSPEEIKFRILRPIEKEMGRVRSNEKYASRTIDLDLIAYDDLVVTTEELVLPDPLIAVRPFLAIPLAEIAPDFVLTGKNVSIKKIASTMGTDGMKALYEYTDLIRKEIIHGY